MNNSKPLPYVIELLLLLFYDFIHIQVASNINCLYYTITIQLFNKSKTIAGIVSALLTILLLYHKFKVFQVSADFILFGKPFQI